MRRNELADILAGSQTIQEIHDLPDAADRTFWEGLPAEVRAALIARGDALTGQEIPFLSLSAYQEFSQNGNRTHYEEKYFARRRALTDLVIAECVKNSDCYYSQILDLVWAILEETTWCLPAHNVYVRDTAATPLPDPERPVIDLFAAETAAILALTEVLLFRNGSKNGGKTDEKGQNDRTAETEILARRIDAEIRHRILVPYLREHFWWMGDGEQLMCNWTSWITQNILLAIFTRREGSAFADVEKRAVLRQAAVSLDYYLDDYSDDGCCSEGIFYYGHSALCLFGCLDVMDRITAGGMSGAWELDKIRRIAAYPATMYVGEGRYFNFSDASPYPGRRSARDYLFALRTGNADYAAFTAADFRSQTMEERLLFGEQSLYDHLLQLSCYREMETVEVRGSCPKAKSLPGFSDVFYPDTGLMAARDAHWALAAKAGGNGDIHNHNDIGSVTLYLDSRPFLIDLGVETYSAKTFSDSRYEIWTMQSAYHNTLNFRKDDRRDLRPDLLQQAGAEYRARDVRCGITEDEAELSMEFAGAYAEPRIRSVRRCVRLEKGTEEHRGRVVIRDDIIAEKGLLPVLTFMTCEKPEIIETAGEGTDPADALDTAELRRYGSVVRIRVGELGVLAAGGIAEAAVETCPIRDARLAAAWEHDCYRILLAMEDKYSMVVLTG